MMVSNKLKVSWRTSALVALLILTACAFPFPSAVQENPPKLPTELSVVTGEAPQYTATAGKPQISTSVPVIESTQPASNPPAAETALPVEATATIVPPLGPALAFLNERDIWIVDTPGSEAYPLTVAGDILGFTWAPNGERIAAFNGHTLCFYHRDGSVRAACLDLGLTDEQASIERRLILSPDQRFVVLWNPINPQDEGAIGWMIVALDSTNLMYRIEDPVDWGAALTSENERGGFTGQPVFLPDGRLIGTLSHRSNCGSGGCHYQLFQFDFASRVFIPFANKPEDGFSEGLSLSLIKDGHDLANFGTFFSDCENYITLIDTFNIDTQERQTYNLEGEALTDLAFNPQSDQAILARTSGCNSPDENLWAAQCGLSQGFDILPMQIWNPASTERVDIYPGVMPAWSADGEWLAFQSCLAQDASDHWAPSGETSPEIFLLNPLSGETLRISSGMLPQWQPTDY